MPPPLASQPAGTTAGSDPLSTGPDARRGTSGRLRTRMMLFFLLTALPALLVSATGIVLLDRLIADAIATRNALMTSTWLVSAGNKKRRGFSVRYMSLAALGAHTLPGDVAAIASGCALRYPRRQAGASTV